MIEVPLYPSSGDEVEFDPKQVLGRSYRGTSLIRKRHPLLDRHRALGIVLL